MSCWGNHVVEILFCRTSCHIQRTSSHRRYPYPLTVVIFMLTFLWCSMNVIYGGCVVNGLTVDKSTLWLLVPCIWTVVGLCGGLLSATKWSFFEERWELYISVYLTIYVLECSQKLLWSVGHSLLVSMDSRVTSSWQGLYYWRWILPCLVGLISN